MLSCDHYKLYSHKGWQQHSERMLKIKVKFNLLQVRTLIHLNFSFHILILGTKLQW